MPVAEPGILRPELTVAAVVERQGRFLLVEERAGGRLVINQPAGHVEDGESLATAVIREALEETAWHFVPQAIVGVYLWRPAAGHHAYLRIAFAGTCRNHEQSRPLDTGIERVLWLTRAGINARQAQLRSPMVLRAVDDYLQGSRYPLDLVQGLEPEQLACRAAVL